jgi:cytochrome c oxidase subunit I
MAMLMRWELAFPETAVPGFHWVPEPFMYDGAIPPNTYNAMFTMHATIMIFFVVMPILVGCFGNFLIPLMIGARDMAFPKLNMLSFWVGAVAGVIMLSSFFVTGGPAAAGWTSYAPLSAVPIYTGVDWGQDLWCISIIVLGASSLMGSINYITTIINMRTKGMYFFRLPLVIWSLFITAILLLLALPVLTTALALLLFDRMGGTHFFLPAGGGEPLLWQHLFWFFGHPEVYIMILPAMGISSEIISVFSRKPIFGYRAMAYAMIAIAFLSWVVWGHHMFQSGMDPALGSSFMITTMIIGVPSAIKTFNWLGTLYKGNIHYTVAMMNALAFVAMFVIGGLSGIWMASTPVDMYIHDTYFIVAHIHYVLFGGSLFGIFAGITYWYPKMFGRMMSEKLGKVHFWITFVVQLHLLPDAHPRDGRAHAPDLQSAAVRFPEADHSDQRIYFDQRLRARRRAVPVPREHHLQLFQGREGHRESVARQYSGVDDAVAAAARQLARAGADRLPWTVRVQLA